MDDAVRFRLVVADRPPAGELVVQVAVRASLEAIGPEVNTVRKMARTFFGDKLDGVDPRPDTDQPVALYVVGTLPELGDDDFEGLSAEGAAPRRVDG